MVPVKVLPYCFGQSIFFLFCHAFVLMLKLSDKLIFTAILLSRAITQYLAFLLLKKGGYKLTFKSIFYVLCLTQVFSVLLLTIYSAYNPFEIVEPINFEEVVFSLFLFGLLMPLLIASIIWFEEKRKLQQA